MESETTTPQYARRGGRGGGRGRGGGWRGSKNKYYPGGAQNPQANNKKRWQPRTSELDNSQDQDQQPEGGMDGLQPGAVVVQESDIPAQALQARPPQKRPQIADCPYRGWDQYLPQYGKVYNHATLVCYACDDPVLSRSNLIHVDYHIGHEFDAWIKEFQQYFVRALIQGYGLVSGMR